MKSNKRRILYSLGFMLPAIIVVCVIVIVPVVENFYYSFFKWDILDINMNFVGLSNYKNFFEMDGAMKALRNTIIYAVLAAVFKNLVGLCLAIVLNSGFKTQKILRTCFLSTTMVGLVISGFTWKYIYSPSYGIGYLLSEKLGMPFLNQDWLGNKNLVLFSVLFVSVWQIAGKYMVIYLAGLQAVPQDLYEACMLDGANSWKKFRCITLPMIIPAITVGVMNAVIQGLKVFDEIYAMTKGGPGYASETLTSMMYTQIFFNTGRAGFGSAISVILFLLVLAISLSINKYLRHKEDIVYG